MGEIEIIKDTKNIYIHANMIVYGNAADEKIAQYIAQEIGEMWSEPKGKILLDDEVYTLSFMTTWQYEPKLDRDDIIYNNNPRNNYFRIEEYSKIQISMVDDLGSNTGYFLKANLYEGSTTAAHEFGHTMGLKHPQIMDIRGHGRPGIMYPRGTLVDPEFQYNPLAKYGEPLHTMNPIHRRVMQQEIDLIGMPQLIHNQELIVGKYTAIFHEMHIDPTPLA
jgi:hypothetical protein